MGRRRPRKHTVHTRHPRYSIPSYIRGREFFKLRDDGTLTEINAALYGIWDHVMGFDPETGYGVVIDFDPFKKGIKGNVKTRHAITQNRFKKFQFVWSKEHNRWMFPKSYVVTCKNTQKDNVWAQSLVSTTDEALEKAAEYSKYPNARVTIRPSLLRVRS